MLVLSRRRGERIVIGPNIELTVVAVCGNRVRLGVQAPPEVTILRNELLRSGDQTGAVAQNIAHSSARERYSDAGQELVG